MFPLLTGLFTRWALPVAGAAAVLLGTFALGHTHGSYREQLAWEQRERERVIAESSIALRRAEASIKLAAEREEAKQQITTVTKEIIRYVPRLLALPDPVPAGPVPGCTCVSLPSAWRLLHDSAAEGRVPAATEQPDGTPVAAEDLAETVVENYGTCNDTADQLRRLQEWIRQNHEASVETQ